MIYAPLRPLLRLWRIVVYFLANLDHILDTNFERYAYTEAGRRELEAGIAFGEDGINIMIYARTCELLGVTPIIKSPVFQEPAKSRPIAELSPVTPACSTACAPSPSPRARRAIPSWSAARWG